MTDIEPPGFITGSIACTQSGSRFVTQHGSDIIAFTADRTNEQLFVRFYRDLQFALHPEENPSQLRTLDSHPQLRLNRTASNMVYGELMLTRYIDSYLTYLSELLREIFLARPEVLRSNEQIAVEEVLQFSSIDELVSYIADKKVTQLSYSGLGDISNFFQSRLGLVLIDDKELLTRMQEWVALRNLYTHRRGVVDQRARDAGLGSQYEIGARAYFSREEGASAMRGIFASMHSLDGRAAAKFRLEVHPVSALSAQDRVEGSDTDVETKPTDN